MKTQERLKTNQHVEKRPKKNKWDGLFLGCRKQRTNLFPSLALEKLILLCLLFKGVGGGPEGESCIEGKGINYGETGETHPDGSF